MKVLITGGAGFIGSHLTEYLVANDWDVTILDNLNYGTLDNINHIISKLSVREGDIKDENLVDSLVKNCDLVIHLAAILGVDNILSNTIHAISTNFFGSEIVMKAALKYEKRIIIASTSEIYGKNNNDLICETDDRIIGSPQKLRWTYADSKALEESVAHFLYLNSNLRVTTIRLFNTVGPRQSGKYGMVIPRFIKSALKDDPLYVFGNGSQRRVFCHVKDVVQAIYSLAINEDAVGQVYNIGGVGEISILDLAHLIKNKTQSNSIIEFKTYHDAYGDGFEDMARRVPDISKIEKLVGWTPTLNLDTILNDVIEFEKIIKFKDNTV